MTKKMTKCLLLVLLCLLVGCAGKRTATDVAMPGEWIDEETGHRVARLSAPDVSSQTFYFHQNCFTETGDLMVYTGHTAEGRSAFSIELGNNTIRRVASNVAFEIVAPKRRELFYLDGNRVMATHVDTLETREITSVPDMYTSGRGFSVNADETLLAGCYAEGERAIWNENPELSTNEKIKRMYDAGLRNALYTIDIETGEIKEILCENTWFGHVQFSPTNQDQIEFCHEGPERLLDRMWVIRTDGSDCRKVFAPPCKNTFVTHEFWDSDGSCVWFDLQVPRLRGHLGLVTYVFGPRTYLAKVNITTGAVEQYRLPLYQRSWHYNVSRDGSILCGDGEGRFFEAGRSGKWIYLYKIRNGEIAVQKIFDMSEHSYAIAPNAHITPDNRRVVFTADMHGIPQIYAVEIAEDESEK
jgi:oligogalacturonide lyase